MNNDAIPDIREGWFYDDVVVMDAAFVRSMAAAIRAGVERPVMVGIDTRPCTRHPLVLNPVPVLRPNGHAMGDAADLGDGGMTGFSPRRAAPISLARSAGES